MNEPCSRRDLYFHDERARKLFFLPFSLRITVYVQVFLLSLFTYCIHFSSLASKASTPNDSHYNICSNRGVSYALDASEGIYYIEHDKIPRRMDSVRVQEKQILGPYVYRNFQEVKQKV